MGEVAIAGLSGRTFVTISVIATRCRPAAGTRYLIEPNGSRTAFTAATVPSPSNPQVFCTTSLGVPFLVEWDYDGTPLGHYAITFADSTRWVTDTARKLVVPGNWYAGATTGTAVLSGLAQVVDRVGNAIDLNYGTALPDSGFPLISTITDASTGGTLLSISRATDGTGNILGVSDAYSRSVYYHESYYASTNIPGWVVYAGYQELDQVSQIVTTGTGSPPIRWQYGYTNVYNGDTNMLGPETVPFLTGITVPSPTGTGTSTASINYTSGDDTVSSLTDANGNTTTFTVVDGSHTKVTIADSLGSVAYSYTVGFDSNMSETTRTDGTNTNVLYTNTYADPNDPYRPSQVTDANSRTSSATWDGFGNLQTATSARGTLTTYSWSYTAFPLGRLMQVQQGTKTPTSYAYYEPSGLPASITSPAPGTSGTGATVTRSFTFDSLGNPLTATGPGNNATSTETVTLNYTTDGTYSQPAAVGQALTITDNLGKTAHRRYDSLGRPVTAVDALGNEVDVSYNLAGQPVQVLLPATGQSGPGQSATANVYQYPGGPLATARLYDESGVLFRQSSFTNGPEGERLARSGSAEPVSLVYDAAYRLRSLADGNSHATVYAYNAAGYLASVTYPGGDSVQYPRYDLVGNRLQRIDGRGLVTNYLYTDAGGRLSDVQYPASPGLNLHVAYDGYGRANTGTDGSGSYSASFDDEGNVTSRTTSYTGGPGGTFSYTFYPDGSVHTVGSPAGTFTRLYDADGRLASLTNPFGETSQWTYLANGWLKTQTLANGAVATNTFNALGEVVDLWNQDAGGGTLSRFTSLSYDPAGSRLAQTATVSGSSALSGTSTFQYDLKNQLSQEQTTRSGGFTHNFSYDGAGNPTSFAGSTHSFNTDNQDTVNTYDGNGNPTTYGGVGLSFDPENRLTAYGSLLTAGYTAADLRAWKQTAVGRTYFLYSGGRPVVEMDPAGTITAVNTFGHGLLSRRSGGATTFYTFDPHGSTAQRLDASGTVLSSSGFDVWGNTVGAAGTDPFGYGARAGYYTDSTIGLCLLTHRYYDSSCGRFVNCDPIGHSGGINVYAYVQNKPTSLVDPLGLNGEELWNYWDDARMEGGGGPPPGYVIGGPEPWEQGGSGPTLNPEVPPGIGQPGTNDCMTVACRNYVENWQVIADDPGSGLLRLENIDPSQPLPSSFGPPGRSWWFHMACKVGDTVFDNVAFPGGSGSYEDWVNFWSHPQVNYVAWTEEEYWGQNLLPPNRALPPYPFR